MRSPLRSDPARRFAITAYPARTRNPSISRATGGHDVPWQRAIIPLAAVPALLVGVLATTTTAVPLLCLLLVSAAAIVTCRGVWAPVAGLAPVLALPATAMPAASFGPLSAWHLLAVATLALGTSAWIAHGRPKVGLRTVGALALLAIPGLISSVTLGSSSSFGLSLCAVWVGALLLGVSASASRRDTSSRLALVAMPLAVFAIVELAVGRNVWSSVVGPLAFESFSPFRVTSTLGHPLVAAVVLVFFAVLLTSFKTRMSSVIVPVLLLGAAATLSRTMVVGLAVSLLALLAVRRGDRRGLVRAALVTLIVAAIAVAVVPSFSSSVRDRVSSADLERSRESALHSFASDLQSRPITLVFGTGLGSSSVALQRTADRGDAQYDNQYITLIHDVGGVFVLVAIALLLSEVVGAARQEAEAKLVLPALLGMCAMFTTFDGLYWASTAALFWFTCGLFAGSGSGRS
jgi:hypothetical protein